MPSLDNERSPVMVSPDLLTFPDISWWEVKTVPKSTTDKSTRLDFPKNWGGLTDEELERESGIEGLTFCHATLFLAVAKDLETAIKVVNKAIEEKKWKD